MGLPTITEGAGIFISGLVTSGLVINHFLREKIALINNAFLKKDAIELEKRVTDKIDHVHDRIGKIEDTLTKLLFEMHNK